MLRPAAGMEQVVTPDNFRLRIGQQWKSEAEFLNLAAIDLRWVDTDGDDANAARVKLRNSVLKTP